MSEDNDFYHCSFCGKFQDEVDSLIAGPRVYICNNCVQLCVEVIESEMGGFQDLSEVLKIHAELRSIEKMFPEAYTMVRYYIKGVFDALRNIRIEDQPCSDSDQPDSERDIEDKSPKA